MKASKGNSPVTAMDIAERVGVSRTTVSMVLRGEAEKRSISPTTAERVLAAAKELNYIPNQWASNFRRQRSGMIGVVLVDLTWNWAQLAVKGMSAAFQSSDYTPFVAIHDFDQERARRELLSCVRRRDEGVITQPSPGLEDVYERIVEVGLPLVFMGDRPTALPKANCVAWDSAPDAALAIRHLIETGRKRIGFFGYEYPMPLNEARFRMYLAVLEEAGLEPEAHWIARPPIGWSLDQLTEHAIDRMFKAGRSHPDAIFVLNDGLAVPLLDALEVRGIRVPEDAAVIGMGDYPICDHVGIGLSTVREPIEEMGRQAAELMMDLIDKPPADPVQILIPCGKLEVRRTTIGTKWSKH